MMQNNATTVFASEIAAIQAALNAVAHPSEEITALQRQHDEIGRQLTAFREQPQVAVSAYNEARTGLVVATALSQGLGYCSRGDHLAPLETLSGLITTGAYVTSGYYEYLRSYDKRGTVCEQCQAKLRDYGSYDGEHAKNHTYELKDPKASLAQIATASYLERLAREQLGLTLPPKADYDSLDRIVTIGEMKFTAPK